MRYASKVVALVSALAAPVSAHAGALAGTITAEGGLAAGTTVYLEGGPASVKEALAPQPKRKVAITQKNSAFAPSAVVVTAGSVVDFPNEDKIYHNVFSLTEGNEFDLGLYRGGVSKTVTLKKTGEIDIYCNIHPDMIAKVLVVETPYVASVAGDGKYSFADVPAGTWTVKFWSPDHEAVSKTVTVAGADARTDASLKRRKESKAHLNKNGEQYGRYK